MLKGNGKAKQAQGGKGASRVLTDQIYQFAKPVLGELKARLDRRLVRTFLDLVIIILMHRNRHQGLLLSELGGQLLWMERAPAGTKRISNLLHAEGWEAELIEQWLWQQGDQRLSECEKANDPCYVIWDESEIEKPESLKAERLCAVRSAKARRLKRIKKGYYNPPGGRPIFVPGIHWFQVVVAGLKSQPCLAHYHWWTTRGTAASTMRAEEGAVLQHLAKRWGQRVLHIWDRGFAGAPWLLAAIEAKLRFVVRWKKGNYLLDEHGQRWKPSELSRRKRSVDHKLIHDAKRRCERKTGIVFSRFACRMLPTNRYGWSSPARAPVVSPGSCSPTSPS